MNYSVVIRFVLLCILLTLIRGSIWCEVDVSVATPSSVLVRLKEGEEKTLTKILAEGYTVLRDFSISPAPIPRLFCLRIPEHAYIGDCVTRLRGMSGVLYVEEDIAIFPAYIPSDPEFSKSWGLHNTGQFYRTGRRGTPDADIDAPEAWNITRGSKSVVVAVVDTGVNYNHPDLSANIWSNLGEVVNGIDDDNNGFIDDIRGWDFTSSDNDPMDIDGHGTSVAGVIGASADNSRGSCGVCHEVSIMVVRVPLGVTGGLSGVIAGVQYAVASGAHIINASWGTGTFSQALSDAVTLARDAGVIFIAAAGNNGSNNDTTPYYPSSFSHDNIIGVAASTARDALASFSDYGSISVDLAAPGEDIYSTDLSGYAYKSGTSFAAPFVSGVAALLKSVQPALSYSQLKNRIISSATRLSSLSGKVSSGGRLNAYDALEYGAPLITISSLSASVIGPGQSVTFSWQSNKSGNFLIEVGGDGAPGSGVQIDSGSCISDVLVDTTVYEDDIPDNQSSTVFVIVTAGSESGFSSVTLTDDQLSARATVVYPSPDSTLGALTEIRGIAVDSGGAGVSSVSVSLYNGSFYYTGASFTSTDEVWLAAAGAENWQFDAGLVIWEDGRTYTIRARAQDSVGNVDTSPASSSFTYRVGAPTVVVQSVSANVVGPGQSSTIAWLSDTDGDYVVEVGGTGVVGSGVVAASGSCLSGAVVETHISESLIEDNSTARVYIFVTGTYTGNTSVEITDDHQPPHSNILEPLNKRTYASLPAVFGRAQDYGGAVISEVAISIRSGAFFYSGTAFDSPTECWLTVGGTTEWNFDANSVQWTDGTYWIRSRAKDSVGNIESPSSGVEFYYSSGEVVVKDKGSGCSLATGSNEFLGWTLPASIFLLLICIRRILRLRDIQR